MIKNLLLKFQVMVLIYAEPFYYQVIRLAVLVSFEVAKMVTGFVQLDAMQGISLIEAILMELLHRTQTRCNYGKLIF
jgi:hypothetical protein